MTAILTRAANSSAIVRFVRQIVGGSVLCEGVRALNRYIRLVEGRILVGLGGPWRPEDERRVDAQIVKLIDESRLSRVAQSLLLAPLLAARDAGIRRLTDAAVDASLAGRISMVGIALVIAVLTHMVIMVAFGISVDAIAWAFRLSVAGAGVFAAWQPATIADAWRDRAARTTTEDS